MKRVLLLVSLVLASCGGEVMMTLPDGFVRMPDAQSEWVGYAYRATTADGVVIGVRDIDAETTGGLSFWERAVTTALEQAGYAKLEREETRTASGEPAVLVRFGRDVERRTYDYWLLVCVEGERVVIVEVGGERSLFEPLREAVAASLASVRLD